MEMNESEATNSPGLVESSNTLYSGMRNASSGVTVFLRKYKH